MGVPPIAGWFIRENTIYKWMIQGYPYFRTPPFSPQYRFLGGHMRTLSHEVSKMDCSHWRTSRVWIVATGLDYF